MNILIDGCPTKDRLGNPIYTDFRNMLKLENIFTSEISDERQWLQALVLLYGEDLEDLKSPIEDLVGEIVWFFCGGVTEISGKSGGSNKRLYDFEQDADYIIAGFKQAYNIDLTLPPESFTLHWWLFLAYFRALPENTEMARRMGIRAVDTSKMKGSQKKDWEIRKRAVALKGKRKSETATKENMRERLLRRFKTAKELKTKEV